MCKNTSHFSSPLFAQCSDRFPICGYLMTLIGFSLVDLKDKIPSLVSCHQPTLLMIPTAKLVEEGRSPCNTALWKCNDKQETPGSEAPVGLVQGIHMSRVLQWKPSAVAERRHFPQPFPHTARLLYALSAESSSSSPGKGLVTPRADGHRSSELLCDAVHRHLSSASVPPPKEQSYPVQAGWSTALCKSSLVTAPSSLTTDFAP